MTKAKGKLIRCQRCQYEWYYRGKNLELVRKVPYPLWVQCPRCRTTVKFEKGDAYEKKQ